MADAIDLGAVRRQAAPAGQYTPLVPWAPVPTACRVAGHPNVPLADGSTRSFVSMVYDTAVGTTFIALTPDEAIEHAEKILHHARLVKTGLHLS